MFNSHLVVKYCFQPFFSYAFRGRANEASNYSDLVALFHDMFESQDDFITQTGTARLAQNTSNFTKSSPTHLVYKEVRFHHLLPRLLETLPEFRGIGIVRDPRFVLASWFKAPREFDSSWSPTSEWRGAPLKNAGLMENWYGFERWVELTKIFLRLASEYPKRFVLIRYEDLVRDPYSVMKQLLELNGLGMLDQTRRFIQATTSVNDNDPYGVFRAGGENGLISKQHGLCPSIAETICQEIKNTPLERFLTPCDG
jgi:hypothetical protein